PPLPPLEAGVVRLTPRLLLGLPGLPLEPHDPIVNSSLDKAPTGAHTRVTPQEKDRKMGTRIRLGKGFTIGASGLRYGRPIPGIPRSYVSTGRSGTLLVGGRLRASGPG